jgi:hypothetical protein
MSSIPSWQLLGISHAVTLASFSSSVSKLAAAAKSSELSLRQNGFDELFS